jgi:hypothetical protein
MNAGRMVAIRRRGSPAVHRSFTYRALHRRLASVMMWQSEESRGVRILLGDANMSGDRLTIKLTHEQQKQIKDATGKNITELNINLASSGGLSEKELDKVAGGVSSDSEIVIKFTTTTKNKVDTFLAED